MPFMPLLVIYFLWRMAFLLFVHPLNLVIYAEEELYRGMIGRELLDGLKIAFYQYRADDYSGGSLLMGAAASIFFKIFGLSFFSLKLIPVVLFAGALAAWYYWLLPFYGRRVAASFTLLMIFSPYLFTRFALTVLGDHPETIFFTAASLYFFFKTLETPKPRWIYPALLGLLSGIGLWMAYIYAVTLLATAFYWAVKEKRFWSDRSFYIAFLFFGIGFSPWIAINCCSQFQGLSIQGAGFFDIFHWKFFIKKVLNFHHSSPYLLFAVHQLPSVVPEFSPLWVTRLYRVLYLLPMLFFAWFQRQTLKKLFSGHSPARFAVLYLGLFILISQATEYREVRYFIPAQPFVFFLAYLCVDRLTQKFRIDFLRKIYLGSLILLSAALHVRTFYPEYAGEVFRIKPYSFEWFLLSPACSTPEKCFQTYGNFRNKERLDPRDQFVFKSGVTQKLLEEMPFRKPGEELIALKKRAPGELHRYLDYYFGYETLARNEENLQKTLEILKNTGLESGESRYWAALGVFRYPFRLTTEAPSLLFYKNLAAFMQPEAIPEFWRQVGFLWAEYYEQSKKNPAAVFAEVRRQSLDVPDEVRVCFLEGAGRFFYLQWYLNPYDELFSFDSLPRDIAGDVVRGAGIGLAESQNFFARIFFKMFMKRLNPAFEKDFAQGYAQGAAFIKDFHQGYP